MPNTAQNPTINSNSTSPCRPATATAARRTWLHGLFTHVEKLQSTDFSTDTRAAFERALSQGMFDEEESDRSIALERELFGAVAVGAGRVSK